MIRKALSLLLTGALIFSGNTFAQVANPLLLPLNPKLAQVDSPEMLSKYMRKNFKFVEDQKNFGKVDHWQSPEEMLNLKRGDCEDFALFADAALKDLGLESQVVSFYGKNRFAHTVTVFKSDGKWRVFNDGKLYKYDTATIEESLSKVYGQWTWAAFTEKRKNRGWLKKIFYNPSYQPRSEFI